MTDFRQRPFFLPTGVVFFALLLGAANSLANNSAPISCISVCSSTGAGGSIGSELARQLIQLNPKKIILIDQNELSLYNLSRELNCINIK